MAVTAHRQGGRRARGQFPTRAVLGRAPRADTGRRPDRHSVLRRLPLRSAYGAGRVGGTTFPCVPGHEIVGRVVKVGAAVKDFKEGDLAGVGCMVDSDRTCESCRADLEQFCDKGAVFTYNGKDKHTGGMTYGGYSKSIVVDQHFVLRIPTKLDLAAAAPLLCAGITTYSPMRHWKVEKGQKVGVVGLGGLGHMAVKFAHAFGAHVVLFTLRPARQRMRNGSARTK